MPRDVVPGWEAAIDGQEFSLMVFCTRCERVVGRSERAFVDDVLCVDCLAVEEPDHPSLFWRSAPEHLRVVTASGERP